MEETAWHAGWSCRVPVFTTYWFECSACQGVSFGLHLIRLGQPQLSQFREASGRGIARSFRGGVVRSMDKNDFPVFSANPEVSAPLH